MATEVVAVERTRRYRWPDAQLNFWMLVVMAGGSLCLGVFAQFMTIQTQIANGKPTPWLFPYEVTVGALTVSFILFLMFLASQNQLLPGIVMVGSFVLFVLWLTGLIESAIMQFGSSHAVNSLCQTYVAGQPFTGVQLATLAYLEQVTICNCWNATFAFQVVLCVFFVWMMIMAYQVNNDDFR